jgi:hypothetical protein
MSPEVKEKTQADILANDLLERMLNEPEQLKLFEPDKYAHFSVEAIRKLKQANPNKVVVDADKLRDYRIMAGFIGAGFHASQYQDIMYTKSDPEEIGALEINLIGQRSRVPEFRGTHNRIVDEVAEEFFTSIADTTQYDLSTGHYITTERDIKKVFVYDFDNLKTCKELDFDLLYERED